MKIANFFAVAFPLMLCFLGWILCSDRLGNAWDRNDYMWVIIWGIPTILGVLFFSAVTMQLVYKLMGDRGPYWINPHRRMPREILKDKKQMDD